MPVLVMLSHTLHHSLNDAAYVCNGHVEPLLFHVKAILALASRVKLWADLVVANMCPEVGVEPQRTPT